MESIISADMQNSENKTSDSKLNPTAKVAQAGLGLPFYLLWLGQSVSVFGTALSAYALSVWLFQRTGSVIDFTYMTLAATLPALLAAPWAGSFADRHDRRRIIMCADSCAALAMGTLGLLVWANQFQVWHLYCAEAVAALAVAFSTPAALASVTNMVPKSQFGRAIGMFQAVGNLAGVSGPLLASVLLGMIGMLGIIGMDVMSFVIALLCLAFIRFPQNLPQAGSNQAGQAASDSANESASAAAPAVPTAKSHWFHTAMQDFRAALAFFRQHPSLRRIYIQMASAGLLTGMVGTMFTPFVLSLHSAQNLALILAIGGVGGIMGGLVMVAWGGPKLWSPWLLLLHVGEGLALIIAGRSSSLWLLAGCAFYVFFSFALLGSCIRAVWQRKVPAQQQGSVQALQRAIEMLLAPIGVLMGGLLVQYLLTPALLPGGALAALVASFGKGQIGGIRLLFEAAGVVLVLLSLSSLASKRVWRLEREVGDAV